MNLPYQNCTGCGACFNICPKSAINMLENREGYLYPSADENSCIRCGLCERICPELNPPLFNPEANVVYAAWNKNNDIRIDSSSGGVFDSLARTVLRNHGVVYGAAWSEEVCELKHIRIENENDIERLRKSKYVQSIIGNTYSQVNNDLSSNREVLFSGTPCQIAGLKNYLRDCSSNGNLHTIEILCHGVPSQKVIKNYVLMLEKKYNKKIVRINFRHKDKKRSWRASCCCYCICADGSEIFDESTLDSIFWTGFLGNVCLRKSCASCNYAKSERVADITLGDYWGIWEEDNGIYDTSKGISLVILNSKGGLDLINRCETLIEIREANKELAYKHNLTLSKPFPASANREYFFKNLGRVRYDKLIKKCFRRRFVSLKVKAILGERLSDKISRVIHG